MVGPLIDEQTTTKETDDSKVSLSAKARRSRVKRPGPLDLDRLNPIPQEPSPTSSPPSLPRCKSGSNEQISHGQKHETCVNDETEAIPLANSGNYRAPYVEDSLSSHRSGKSPAGPLAVCSNCSSSSSSTAAKTGRKVSSPKPTRCNRGCVVEKFVSEAQDKSSDSASPPQSERRSDVSTGSKTVRFKASTTVRSSRSLSSDGRSSSENSEARLKPSDDAQPTRVSIYGDLPPKRESHKPDSHFFDLFTYPRGRTQDARYRYARSPMSRSKSP